MHGLGNDFMVVDGRDQPFDPDPDTLRGLSSRRTGVGFDQFLMLDAPKAPAADVAYRVFNADGGEVSQCGNGARCVAYLAAGTGDNRRRELCLESPAGLHAARLEEDGSVSVSMGEPDFRPAALPFLAEGEGPPFRVETREGSVIVTPVSMGNPHAVIEVGSLDDAPVDRLGSALNTHPAFPEGVNVGFVEVRDRHSAGLRVYERGVGETLACGTGACAAAAALIRSGRGAELLAVTLPGGRLMIRWRGPGETLWMQGEAAMVFEGQIAV
jgi:diaminopimelate epimerase